MLDDWLWYLPDFISALVSLINSTTSLAMSWLKKEEVGVGSVGALETGVTFVTAGVMVFSGMMDSSGDAR